MNMSLNVLILKRGVHLSIESSDRNEEGLLYFDRTTRAKIQVITEYNGRYTQRLLYFNHATTA